MKLKEQGIPSGFNADDYTVERLWAKAQDGVEVPMAIVAKRAQNEWKKSCPAIFIWQLRIKAQMYISALLTTVL
ncbi:hypothetical protein MASR1M46_02500 [Bacteroidales bacterium]